ncbi:MAG: helix-hairpin-helix domain-containing protein [Campylobacterota bacterium]|nr:helix-hairpin-helix domain-containing protein [Campylobacterota bacterium]
MKILAIMVLGVSLLFGVVDINSASKSELMSLNGIGEKKAEAILKYRETTCFANVNGLLRVKGIGPKLIEKNKKDLKAGKCKGKKK